MSCNCFGVSIVRRKSGGARDHQDLEGKQLGNIRNFSYNELRNVTDNFHPGNKIGQGGFGIVYKGILKDGTQVAVKTLSAESKQGTREFLTEINTISNVRHPNLVELIGWCAEENKRALVYEYVVNNSLDRALLGRKSTTVKLDWGKRSAICMGTARGLAYLHEELVPHIVHRDIKANGITHISTKIAGTTGYLAPEYVLGGQLTLKADVYSFGVLILEVVSGRSSSKANWGGTEKFLLEYAWQLYEEGKLLELVDPELDDFPEEEIIRYIKVAFFCTQAAANRRPLMSQVIEMLTRNVRINEKQLTAPGYFQDSGSLSGFPFSNKKSSESSTSYQTSSAPITITQLDPR
ncbi:hypothetical protein Vadar_025989 [Vaccinium darrowii]|uniref:Uncharacterized protein n=1 Tax=Vaccinium darrowii TaxID=229202 RepID=A0ACB7YZC8_9ERIC|nr:hypothetical protein Vadar_025989 [Vaccinium darrowii]